MIRATEILLFLLPLLLFAAWRVAVARGLDGPPSWQVALAFAAVSLLAAFLYGFAEHGTVPPGHYAPAESRDGRIVPGHAG